MEKICIIIKRRIPTKYRTYSATQYSGLYILRKKSECPPKHINQPLNQSIFTQTSWASRRCFILSFSGQSKILPKLDTRPIANLLRLHKNAIGKMIGVLTGHCIMANHAERMGLEHLLNDFCRSVRHGKEEKTILPLLETCLTLRRRRKG